MGRNLFFFSLGAFVMNCIWIYGLWSHGHLG